MKAYRHSLYRHRIWGLACVAALGIGACGKSSTPNGTNSATTADPAFVDSAPTQEALTADTGSGASAARDDVAAAPAAFPTAGADYLSYTQVAGHADGPITVSATEREVASDLMAQVKIVLAKIQEAVKQNPATKTGATHVWVLTDNGIDYRFTENKGKAGFGWKLEVKKSSDADSAYVECMLGRLKRDTTLTAAAHGEGAFGIDFDKYNSVVGGSATGQAFAAFRHNKVGAYHLYAINNFSIDGTTKLSDGLYYINIVRLFAAGNAPERVHLRGGGHFDVFTPNPATSAAANLENIFFRLHRFVGIGGYGHARVKNGDIHNPTTTFRVIRECWDKSETTFARLTWECVGAASADDSTANSTCTLVQSVPTDATAFGTFQPNDKPYSGASTEALAEYCVGGPTTAAGQVISTIDGSLKAIYKTLVAEVEAGASDGTSASVDTSAEAGVDAPTVAVPTASASIDATGN